MDTEKQSQQMQAAGSEFEREPVPKSARLGFKSFIGMYAGEHCAGTELMIGPLFVAAGVGVYDLIMGLLLGNALAVLSLQPRQRRDVLLPRRGDGHRLGHRGWGMV